MESKLKNEVRGGLKTPEVDQDSKAVETNDESTNGYNCELSNESYDKERYNSATSDTSHRNAKTQKAELPHQNMEPNDKLNFSSSEEPQFMDSPEWANMSYNERMTSKCQAGVPEDESIAKISEFLQDRGIPELSEQRGGTELAGERSEEAISRDSQKVVETDKWPLNGNDAEVSKGYDIDEELGNTSKTGEDLSQQDIRLQLEESKSETSLPADIIKPGVKTEGTEGLTISSELCEIYGYIPAAEENSPKSNTAISTEPAKCGDAGDTKGASPEFASELECGKSSFKNKGILKRPELQHPDCTLSTEELKTMSLKFKYPTLKHTFLLKTFYKGEDPDQTMKALLIEDQALEKRNSITPPPTEGETVMCRFPLEVDGHHEFTRHPDCRHSIEELRLRSQKLMNHEVRVYFMHATYCKGVHPDQEMEELLSMDYAQQKYPDPDRPWEEVKKLSLELPKPNLRHKYLHEACRGKNPEVLLKAWSAKCEAGGSLDNKVLSKKQRFKRLELFKKFNEDQMKKYNSSRESGLSHHDAIDQVLGPSQQPDKSDLAVIPIKTNKSGPGTVSPRGDSKVRINRMVSNLPSTSAKSTGFGQTEKSQWNKSGTIEETRYASNMTHFALGWSTGAEGGRPVEASYSLCIQYSDFLMGLKRSPSCKHSLNELIVMAERVPKRLGISPKKLFILLCFQFGVNPGSWDWSQYDASMPFPNMLQQWLTQSGDQLPGPNYKAYDDGLESLVEKMPYGGRYLTEVRKGYAGIETTLRKPLLPTPSSFLFSGAQRADPTWQLDERLPRNTQSFRNSPPALGRLLLEPQHRGSYKTFGIGNKLSETRHNDPPGSLSVSGPSCLKRKECYVDTSLPKRSRFGGDLGTDVGSADEHKPEQALSSGESSTFVGEYSTDPDTAGSQQRPGQDLSPSGDTLHLCIVPSRYPRERFTSEQMDMIENCILDAILKMDDSLKPVFKRSLRNEGRYEVMCKNGPTKTWLYKCATIIRPWPNALLRIIPAGLAKIQASAELPLCQSDDNDKILEFIGKQNTGLNVSRWEVVRRWDSSANTSLSLLVDDESANVLKICSSVNFKLGSSKIIIEGSEQLKY